MSLIELGPIIFGEKLDLIQWLQGKHLLASHKTAADAVCRPINFTTKSEQGSMDGYTWRCPQCYTMKSIRDGSFFAKSKLPLYK